MFSHVTIGTNDLARAIPFYDAILAPLGIERAPGKFPGWASWNRPGEAGEALGRAALQSASSELGQWLDGCLQGPVATSGGRGLCGSDGGCGSRNVQVRPEWPRHKATGPIYSPSIMLSP